MADRRRFLPGILAEQKTDQISMKRALNLIPPLPFCPTLLLTPPLIPLPNQAPVTSKAQTLAHSRASHFVRARLSLATYFPVKLWRKFSLNAVPCRDIMCVYNFKRPRLKVC